jgi:outer membrane protein
MSRHGGEMRCCSATYLLLTALGLAVPAAAQTPLTLTDAIARARAQNPDAAGSAAAERESAQRVMQARARYWPRVDLAESWQRGNQPVFVFSSLLAQRRFTPTTSPSARSITPTPSTTFAPP